MTEIIYSYAIYTNVYKQIFLSFNQPTKFFGRAEMMEGHHNKSL